MKKKKEEKEDIKKRKTIPIIIISIIVLILVLGIFLVIYLNKNKDGSNIKVSELNYVSLLKEDNEAEAAKLIKQNIVKITNTINDKTSIVGTGFFISQGYLITNSHIVDIKGDINIEYSDGITAKAYLYSNSVEYDIALLKVEDVKIKSLLLGSSEDKDVTNSVLAAGFIYNFAGEASISKGILSARRSSDTFVYLQSDISIDTGSSGGPLFDAKGAVIGINVYTTETRTFALSLSSESLSTIIDVLIDEPSINYLTSTRPSNSINSILVEVGYTKDKNLDLYKDKDIISMNNKNNGGTSNIETEKVSYYCEDSSYTLLGKKCVKKVYHTPTYVVGDCKDGYVKEGNMCAKRTSIPAIVEYPCNGTLTENKTCLEMHLWETGVNAESRYGSCPSGQNCYDQGTASYSDTFVAELNCPAGTTKINYGINYIWSNEGKENFIVKNWNSTKSGYIKKYDGNGLEYYTNEYNIYSMCAKSYDDMTGTYTLYTNEELKNSACPSGSTFTANNNNQGFYCKISERPHLYAWNASCNDSSYTVMYSNGVGSRITCGKWVEEEVGINPTYRCESGELNHNDKTCLVSTFYAADVTTICNEGYKLEATSCVKNEIVDAKKAA